MTTPMTPRKRKLIEVALPLEAINWESARENYIYKGNPSSIHKWWAQRPLAACRAVLFAQLVDDPSARPDLYPTEAEQAVRRKELFDLIERLVVWENSNDTALLAEAHQLMKKYRISGVPITDDGSKEGRLVGIRHHQPLDLVPCHGLAPSRRRMPPSGIWSHGGRCLASYITS